VIRLFLVFFGFFLSFLVLEVGIRIQHGALFDTTLLSAEYRVADGELEKPPAQYDSRLGWIPNLGRRTRLGKDYTIIEGNIRSNGSEASESDPSSGLVLVTGDSFVFGTEVNDHETWPAILEEISSQKVINGGVRNYGLDQIYLRTEELIAKYEPDLVLVALIPDDIYRCGHVIRRHAKPYYSIQNDELALQNVPVPLTETLSSRREMDFFRRTFGYSYLVDLVMRRINFTYWLNFPIVLAKDEGRQDAETNPAEEVACKLMESFASLVRDSKTELVIVAQYERYLNPQRRELALRVLNCARNQNLQVVDLFETLSEMKSGNPREFSALYRVHMTEKGNRLVAEQVHGSLKNFYPQ
jgi:lysophospholipase L1-like esterase